MEPRRVRITGLRGLRIARIHGVDIQVHVSLLFMLFYVVFVASAQFPFVVQRSGISPDAIGGSPFVWGVFFALGFFLSVLIHEFAHVLVAQGMGVRVRGITLMMLGGVSEMEQIPEKPYAEFKISVVGPLASFAIAGLLFLGRSYALFPEVEFYCYWLARVNLVLGIFNLLPAFPLDGGRVFRSLLAVKQGMSRATETSVKVAEGLAWALGIWGFLTFNILLMLIALFIYSSARGEFVMMASRGILKGSIVRDVWTQVEPLNESASLQTAVAEMLRTRLRQLPIATGDGSPFILVSDAVRRIPKGAWGESSVRDVATRVSRFVSLDDRLDQLLPDLAAYGALPVSDGNRTIGIITFQEVAKVLEFKGLESAA